MSVLVDGNNLTFAMADAGLDSGRGALCRLLGLLAERTDQRVRVVFDGKSPPPGLAGQIADSRIEVLYSDRRKADAVIAELIQADSAPRRLTVVSTDHEIRQAARRRRCRSVVSCDFAAVLAGLRESRPPRPGEPAEKRRGLTPQQTAQWLAEFGLEMPDDDEIEY
jgi:hypothetical protein